MIRVPAILFVFLLPFLATAQRSIKGKVVNSITGIAVPGSSVFISNTSKGTTSDNAGYFELNNVPAGKHVLVISCIGYETDVYPFSDEQLPLQLKVELQIKVKELANVTVESFEEEGWNKWGKLFFNHFIGTTDNAIQCKIKNTAAIKFRFFKKSNRIMAYADEPLLIENNALGYTIRYKLENFEMNFKERFTTFLGYALFEDKTKQGKEPRDKWQRRRDEAFNGSIMHFTRSVYNNRVQEEGFEVRRMVRRTNTEKARVKDLYRNPVVGTNIISERRTIQVGTTPAELFNDSTNYYEGILKQEDIIDSYGADTLGADSLIVKTEGIYKMLYFPDYLYITYNKELEEENYPGIFQERNPGFQKTHVFLLNNSPIAIDKMGKYDAPQFFTWGYWTWSEKISNMLPMDYEPAR